MGFFRVGFVLDEVPVNFLFFLTSNPSLTNSERSSSEVFQTRTRLNSKGGGGKEEEERGGKEEK